MAQSTGTRGREFTGTVINARMQKTVTVEWPRQVYMAKYDRYLTKRTRIKAHNPDSMAARVGDRVLIRECRPISKTKTFMIVQKLGVDYAYMAREENLKEGVTGRAEKPKEHPQKEDDHA